MPKDETAGLTLQAAWEQAEAAEAEVDVSEDPATTESVEEPEPTEEIEQPAVENVEESKRLFADLDDDAEVEQPPTVTVDDSTEVEFEGDTITIGELKAGYLRQSDYTQKTQEASALRKEAETALNLMNALQQNPRATVTKLWENVRQGEPMVEQSAPAEQTPSKETDLEALLEQKLNERLANDPRLRAIEEQEAADQVAEAFAQLEEVYDMDIPQEDRIYVLQKAMEAGTTDLGLVFGGLMQQRALRDKQRANAQANSSAQGYGGSTAVAQPQKVENKRYTSFREAMNDTFADEGVTEADLITAVSNL